MSSTASTFIDARVLDFTRLVGHLSAPPSLPTSRQIRNQLLNLFLHSSLYPPPSSDTQQARPVPKSERWSLLNRFDARARLFAFGDVPAHLFADRFDGAELVNDKVKTDEEKAVPCWGLLMLTSPQNSLIDPPKEDEDPPVLDIWISHRCQPDQDNDRPTAFVLQILSDLLPKEVRKWVRNQQGKPVGYAQDVFGYTLPQDIVLAIRHHAQDASRRITFGFEYVGQAFFLQARQCWPQPAPDVKGLPNLFMTKVRNDDLELVWEGAHRYYSTAYIGSRAHISCCLRERLPPATKKETMPTPQDVEAPGQSRPIAWSLAHSALAIAATFVIPEWRSRLVDTTNTTTLATKERPPMRASELIIRHISRDIVEAQLYALWACGLSSSAHTWEPTPEASHASIRSSLQSDKVQAWEDMVVVTAESETDNAAAHRMWDRLRFVDLDQAHDFGLGWILFTIPLA
ncbi:hypothetical protein OC844_005201 [Tilletia horrida]|nr:hypothetical protein OC844_005201 [Tilletia horrida]